MKKATPSRANTMTCARYSRVSIGVKYYFLTTYECNTTFLHVRMESAILLFDHVRVQYYFLARECGEEGVCTRIYLAVVINTGVI